MFSIEFGLLYISAGGHRWEHGWFGSHLHTRYSSQNPHHNIRQTLIGNIPTNITDQYSVKRIQGWINVSKLRKKLTIAFCTFQKTTRFCKELQTCIPNSEIYYRRGLDLKKIIPQAIKKDYTDLLVINENRQTPSILFWTSHFMFSWNISISLCT